VSLFTRTGKTKVKKDKKVKNKGKCKAKSKPKPSTKVDKSVVEMVVDSRGNQ
jgi:hypothetical protein